MSKARSYSQYTKEAAVLLGRLIKLGRKNRRWSTIDLAERVGVSRLTLRRIERGDPGCSVGLVFEAAVAVKRGFPDAARPKGMCAGLTSPAVTLLRGKFSRGSCTLLGGVKLETKQVKRKANPGGAHPPAARPRTDGAAPAWSFE